MAKKTGSGEYDIGYGKTPEHTRWKKGQSGNPNGKKTKALSFGDKLKAIADEEIVVHKNGQAVSMTNLEAAYYAAFAKAQGGNPQFLKLILQELGVKPGDMSTPLALNVTVADLAVLQTHADWVALIEQAQAEVAEPAAPEMEEDETDDDPHEAF